jgi:hypothetical protein
MFEVVAEGLQPYIHSCQNQLLRVLRALDARSKNRYGPSYSRETYSRTEINLEKWGMPLLFALADITEKKQEQIDIDEIKQAMTKYDQSLQKLPNSWIGYVMKQYGFKDKIHTLDGNQYNINKDEVQSLLNEALNT